MNVSFQPSSGHEKHPKTKQIKGCLDRDSLSSFYCIQRIDQRIHVGDGVVYAKAYTHRAAGRRGEGLVRQGGAMISAPHADARAVQRVAHRVCAFALKVEKQDRSHTVGCGVLRS